MATAAMLAGGGAKAAGDIYQSQAQAASAGYNAKVALQNAKFATQDAEWAGAEGEQKTGLAGLQTQQEVGKIKTAQAANNVDVNSGSAKNVQKSQAEMGMLNEMNIRSNSARQAYGYETEAASDVAKSELDRKEQSSDKTAGYINAASSFLGSASNASQYSNWLGSTGLDSGGTDADHAFIGEAQGTATGSGSDNYGGL